MATVFRNEAPRFKIDGGADASTDLYVLRYTNSDHLVALSPQENGASLQEVSSTADFTETGGAGVFNTASVTIAWALAASGARGITILCESASTSVNLTGGMATLVAPAAIPAALRPAQATVIGRANLTAGTGASGDLEVHANGNLVIRFVAGGEPGAGADQIRAFSASYFIA